MRFDYAAPAVAFESRPELACKYVAAIPAKDEEDRLDGCLRAFGRQQEIDLTKLRVVVALNNTTDHSLDVCMRVAGDIPCAITVLNEVLPVERAHAGWARKLAMDRAYQQCTPDGLLLTTDADTIVDDDWVIQNARAMATGVAGVAGFVTADPDELSRLDAAVLDRGALEWEYQNLLAAYEAVLDPRPWDPAPRHNQMCGASLALRREGYAAVGGIPPLSVGEDRALFEQMAAHDYRIRHSLSAHVTASARTIGRAYGGMADALRLRHDPDYPCDEILEDVESATFRWRTRHQLRATWGDWDVSKLSAELHITPESIDEAQSASCFGAAWAKLQTMSARLWIRTVTSKTLVEELQRLRGICRSVGDQTSICL